MTLSINIPVSTIMTKNIINVDVKDGLDKAEHLFKKHKIRHIPVTRNRKIVGMLSMNDLLRISFADGAYREEGNIESEIYEMFSINNLMVRTPETVSSKATIREVTELLIKRKYHALPVVDDEMVVGMITTTDLLRYYLSMF
jgi:predicted transcriptional regulator